jgi:hypothetical protein
MSDKTNDTYEKFLSLYSPPPYPLLSMEGELKGVVEKVASLCEIKIGLHF